MANTKISALTAYAGTSVSASIDVMPIVDTTNSVTKKITVSGLATAIGSVPSGTIIDFGGTAAPTGYLSCDGSAVSRSTYSALFTAIGTTWGSGDGTTTFNVPNLNGRAVIGSGTGSVTEAVTASSSNGFTVSSNNTKWITGMTVVVSNLTGFGGTVTATTYYAVRVSATNVRLASTLALAQAEAPDITITGTGTATLTTTFTARTVGEYGGEESHAMALSELLAHTHTDSLGPGASITAPGGGSYSPGASGSAGGNKAMNNMQPFGTVLKCIKT